MVNAEPAALQYPVIDSASLTVVGIGASAGGLEACTKLVAAIQPGCGVAFVFVQHLDPTHASMMTELLAARTGLTVCEAADGLPLAADHLYVIPPGTDLSVAHNALHLTPRRGKDGTRLTFDFLLQSLAESYGPRAACIILSGTGADGSVGLVAIKKAGGFVIVQDPDEAAYDGMPQSAIATGMADRVLPVGVIPSALTDWLHKDLPPSPPQTLHPQTGPKQPDLADIIALLRSNTRHNFSEYKHGTLQRRAERRMALAGIAPHDIGRYLQLLRQDGDELDLLAKDLLIHVTGFFRDPAVFAYLAEHIIPSMVRQHPADRHLRVWVPGCSTGEEVYSLAMLFQEEIARSEHPVRVQLFASDIDADAVATARDAAYPDTIVQSVSTDRLSRFFSQEGNIWRVSAELRALVVFTVQDVLSDAPFSRLDLISCRNLLIYFQPDAQEKAISLFHFALSEEGFLVLGPVETPGSANGRFEAVAKDQRIYRRVGRVDRLSLAIPTGAGLRLRQAVVVRPPSRQVALADLGRRLVLDGYAPAAVLINQANESVFSLGPTDRYLRLATGHPTHDLLMTVRSGLRAKLRTAIDRSRRDKTRIAVECHAEQVIIEAQPVLDDGEALLLVCFVPAPRAALVDGNAITRNPPQFAELELELETTRRDLQAALRDLELSAEEQKAVNEDAVSVNEEFQSTNEELLASKEELQSLNEELTALNSQLQETLDRQRSTAYDLQNVLYSTNIATLFLDRDLRIRFFTPATRSLFAILPGDVGRPLADLHSLAADGALAGDAITVLASLDPAEREIEAASGQWFRRRILPYLTHGGRVEGVVITFNDITSRKRAAGAVDEARREADIANRAKSRFLAAASHDLRQPLQTLSLLQGLLAKTVQGDKAQNLIARQDDTLGSMAVMLDALLDINQIEGGVIPADLQQFNIGELLARKRDEFLYPATAKGLQFSVVDCSQEVYSDPKLLRQMIRNLLGNALKYTETGRVLLGCRRKGPMLSVEVWDTGIGIPQGEIQAIFEEYHQVGNDARERSRGLGLGLSIVQRLGILLGHRVRVTSREGKGSMFAIEIPLATSGSFAETTRSDLKSSGKALVEHPPSTILIIEDDPDLRELLGMLLETEGYRALTARDGPAAIKLVQNASGVPHLLLVDFNLPGGLNGIQAVGRLRQVVGKAVPAIILTGDISSKTMREVAAEGCVQLNKPAKRDELIRTIAEMLCLDVKRHASIPKPERPAVSKKPSTVFVVDDDAHIRSALRSVLEDDGRTVEDFANGEAFLASYRHGDTGCLLIDAYLPGMSGLDLLRHLQTASSHLPAIMITGRSDVAMAIMAMKAGALDFIEKPVGQADLLASIDRALDQARDKSKQVVWREDAARNIASLTPRQREIMTRVVAGEPSKNIAADLAISQRTVENHRASIMRRTGAASLPALARLVLAGTWDAKANVPDAA
ncbi:chemotaxis protein CheB [Lichenicola cladoniae]|uniref:chemotaxis protein CheB n=1 Tax=Lichenicola cladoniae TaxID=1484109 RepID=UPI001EF74F65|nr:chemotaxis protein CheB [Lichenicola cladoniae]